MGLFKKRSTDPEELDHLRSEIAAMAERLDAADADKAAVEHRIQQLATTVAQPPPLAPPPPAPEVSQADLALLHARVQRLSDRLDSPATQPNDPDVMAALESRVDELARDLAAAQSAASTDPHAGMVVATIDPDEYASLRARVDALQSRFEAPMLASSPPPPPPTLGDASSIGAADLDDLRSRVDSLHDRVADVDARITAISIELANQISELAGDLDAMSSRSSDTAPQHVSPAGSEVHGLVDEIRDAQQRLANEQARYQIAFRQELADLAERLQRRH